MFGFLLALLILDGILLSVIVLLQAGKGGGLAAMGGASAGTDSLIGGRQAATLLTKATWITGGVFLSLAIVLSVVSSRQERPESVLRGLQPSAPATAPQPVQIPGTQPVTPQGEQSAGQQPSGGASQPQPPAEPGGR